MLATWACLSLVFANAPAVADELAPSKRAAQALLDEGLELYERHDYTGALVKFNQALSAYPSPKLWYNVAQTQRELDHPLEALTAFDRFLATADGPADALDEARRAVATLHRRLGHLRVHDAESGVELSVDGRIVGRTPFVSDLWVLPGSHVLVIGSGTASASTTVTVAAGDDQAVSLPPMPRESETRGPKPAPSDGLGARSGAGTASPEIRQTLPAPPVTTVHQGWWLGRTWTWVAAGVAVASAAGAATFGLLMQAKYDDLNHRCGSLSATRSGCSPGDFHALDERKTAANVLWIAAGMSALTAGVLFAFEGRSVGVGPVAGQPGLIMRGKF